MIPDNAPDWLKKADTVDARVEILRGGYVIWHAGEFRGGVFRDGEFRGGVFSGGVFSGGVFSGGEFRGGVFRDGEFRGGVFRDGEFRCGKWISGYSAATRAPFGVLGNGDRIRVGCWTGSIAEAKELLDGGDLPSEAPDRDSDAGRLLRAAVIAQIAYQEALA